MAGEKTRKGASARLSAVSLEKGLMMLAAEEDAHPSPRAIEPRDDAVPPSALLTLGRMAETNGGGSLESVPGFDSARARNHGLFPLAPHGPAAAAGADGFRLQNVFGSDNRVAVPDTTAMPWRSICLLSITYENGKRATGTAWFLGERALGTAGHNIRHPNCGRATEILVSPAYDGTAAPFGTYRAEQTWCDPAWLGGNTDPAFDYGVVMLADPGVGRRVGWFGFASYSKKQLNKLLLNVSGYAIDREPRTQYYNGGRLEEADDLFLRYTFDTEGGMSGAPIFALFGTQRVVVGIHTGGNDRTNRARRIDEQLYAVLERFGKA